MPTLAQVYENQAEECLPLLQRRTIPSSVL